MAAAVAASRAGHQVTVFEAARQWGGRARALSAQLPDGSEVVLDNGQHILIGAYTECLALLAQVGVDADAALLRLPLSLCFPDGKGLLLPRLPGWFDRATRRLGPMDVLAGVLAAGGWSWQDKRSLLRAAMRWQQMGFECPPQTTVAQLCASLTPRVRTELIEPLCLSALNTEPVEASAGVFLRVLDDALFGAPGGSHLLLPKVDLGELFPVAAERWLRERGARTELACRVRSITQAEAGWMVDGEAFERVLLACAPWDAARLVAGIAPQWSAGADALRHEPITTVYLQSDAGLPTPLMALRSNPQAPAQFVLDRGQLGGRHGVLAFVVSVSRGEREYIQQQVLLQARTQLGIRDPQPIATVVEKRATFACTPALQRPALRIAPGLLACGDYVAGPYPATLEGAVRNALGAVAAL